MSKKTIYFDTVCSYSAAAIVEDGKIIDYYLEKEGSGTIIGNVYKGKVVNVLNGMQAAFINCGLERNCYISAADLFPDKNKYEGNGGDLPPLLNLKEGDEIMVQVVKAPVGKKGAKVTTNLSFVGKSAIYMPNTDFVGVSRKIADTELRKNLIYTASQMKTRYEGLIVRTAAPYVNRKEMLLELNNMRKIYANVLDKFNGAEVGTLLYSDEVLPVRVLRDHADFNVEKIIVGDKRLIKEISLRASIFTPEEQSVELHDTGRDMFYELGLAEQINKILSPKVELENGAYLVIEKTEALTVIDVNTGKFIGDDSLEQTVYHTNILAAREIARQVRLRNIGGIVVVDFIDMQNANHKKSLVAELKRALAKDKAKCSVLPMSDFGLVEFTRKRTGVNPVELMVKPCKYCSENGFTKSDQTILFELRARLLNLLVEGHKNVFIDLNFDVANKLLAWKEFIDELKEKHIQARIYLIPHRTYHEEHVSFRSENSSTFSLPEGYILLF
ncbi:MAG: Rne/Rng family ribonuclease [Clostridia bacterium]|nr:Rne/Rng family ribonuclease [Clostridia bacterium]